jgi:hypothetical protein
MELGLRRKGCPRTRPRGVMEYWSFGVLRKVRIATAQRVEDAEGDPPELPQAKAAPLQSQVSFCGLAGNRHQPMRRLGHEVLEQNS